MAQEVKPPPRSRVPEATAAFDEGVRYVLEGKHKKARKPLEKALSLDGAFLPARRLLGQTYEIEGDYLAAAKEYTKVIKADSNYSRLLFYDAGEVYYRAGYPKLALNFFRKFVALQNDDIRDFGLAGNEEAKRERAALARVEDRIRATRISSDSTTFINTTELVNLGAPINTQQNDYFPFLSNNRQKILFTRQGGGGDEDLVRGTRAGLNGNTWSISRFGSFNTRQPEGMCTLVRDGETIYFTLCHEQDGTGGCDLYSGLLVGNQITEVARLPDYLNSQTWDSQSAISCDGQRLFFASTRRGGIGGSDIYTAYKLEDGSWSEPKNLGAAVNTPYDEEAPFLSNDGQTLFFASNGHNTLGDQDIFSSWYNEAEDTWTRAMNLGPPVNSPNREIGFHLTGDNRTGFIASDRPGGRGGLDIYRFELSDRLSMGPITYVSGFVSDSLTGDPIAEQRVRVEDGLTYYTNSAGRFFICAESESVLPLAVPNESYLPYERAFAIPSWPHLEPSRVDVLLQKEFIAKGLPEPPAPAPAPDTIRRRTRVIVRNLTVRFSFDDASLTVRQIENINGFVESLEGKSIMNITVRGYTDNTGEDLYNVRLSQERAKAVGIHLKTAGLTANETSIVGLGELPGDTRKELNRKVEVEVRIREVVGD